MNQKQIAAIATPVATGAAVIGLHFLSATFVAHAGVVLFTLGTVAIGIANVWLNPPGSTS